MKCVRRCVRFMVQYQYQSWCAVWLLETTVCGKITCWSWVQALASCGIALRHAATRPHCFHDPSLIRTKLHQSTQGGWSHLDGCDQVTTYLLEAHFLFRHPGGAYIAELLTRITKMILPWHSWASPLDYPPPKIWTLCLLDHSITQLLPRSWSNSPSL